MGVQKKGFIIVFCGAGKGKTSAALGTGLRAWGRGLRVLVIQFIKAQEDVGEVRAAAKLNGFEIQPLGLGFVDKEGPDKQKHQLAAIAALTAAKKALEEKAFELVVLDEVLYALELGLIEAEQLRELIDSKPQRTHLILTGRVVTAEIAELADLVTEMKAIKHPFTEGVPAEKGLDY